MYYNYPYTFYPTYSSDYDYNNLYRNGTPQATFQRGKVKTIVFEIEYPDGSTKVSKLPNAQNVSYIVFDPKYIGIQDSHMFNMSTTDWTLNPTMLVYQYTPVSEESLYSIPSSPFHNGDRPNPHPYCTSIKCGLPELPADLFKPGGLLDGNGMDRR